MASFSNTFTKSCAGYKLGCQRFEIHICEVAIENDGQKLPGFMDCDTSLRLDKILINQLLRA